MDDMILKVKCPNNTKECTVAGGEIMESMVLLGDEEQNMQCLACGYASNKTMKTHIKPFLLVGDNFTVEKETKLQEIVLDYNYKDIKTYETSIYSIGYVVAKYSMGYDFNKLDFICLSDPK